MIIYRSSSLILFFQKSACRCNGGIVVALALFGTTAAITDEQIAALSLGKVILLYSCVGGVFYTDVTLFYFYKKLLAGVMEVSLLHLHCLEPQPLLLMNKLQP